MKVIFCEGIEMLVHDLEAISESGSQIQDEDRVRFLNVTKMLAYLFSWFVCHIDQEIIKDTNDKYVGKVCLSYITAI